MEAKTIFSLVKLIEAGLKGEKSAVTSYARQIEKLLLESGDTEAAERVAAAAGSGNAKKASVTRLSRPLPVDGESRLPVADESYIDAPVHISLPENVNRTVQRFLSCIRHADRLEERGIHAPASLLMHGPPGCGKTLLARYIAHELELPLLTARSDSLISSYLGSTSKNVRHLFEHAASRKCVLFLDEFDALAKMRDDQRELGELKRVVISLLQNIDANGREYILLAATNHPHLLDPAAWRRFAYRVELTYPNGDARREMVERFLKDFIDQEGVEVLTALTDGLTGAQIRDIADDAIRDSVLRDLDRIDLKIAIQLVAERVQGLNLSDDEVVRLVNERCNLSQSRLGEIIGKSQTTISRMLKNGQSE